MENPASRGGSLTKDAIAICGIGIRLSGGIRTTDQFWESLVSSCGTRGPNSTSKNGLRGLNGSNDENGGLKRHGDILRKEVESFGRSSFQPGEKEEKKETMNEQEDKLLEIIYESLEDAGEMDYSGGNARVGCFVAISSKEEQHSNNSTMDDRPPFNGSVKIGSHQRKLATKAMQFYDLRGLR